MPRKNNRPDARRDANEPEIVDWLELHGFKVHRIGGPGDLLVWNYDSRHWVCLEVKTEKGRSTPAQKDYAEKNPDIDIPIVRTKEDALLQVRSR